MKNLIYVIVFLSLIIQTGCDSILEVSPKDRVSEDAVWNDPALVETFLNDIYRGLGSGLAQGKLSGATSNASSIPVDLTQLIVQSTITPGNLGLFESGRGDLKHFDWEFLYEKIRSANIFLEEIESSAIQDEDRISHMKGEVHFLRAYFYHNLLRMYGGVPVITKVYELESDMNVPRDGFAETVDFIVQEAQTAAEMLPLSQEGRNKGRATKGVAMALKARILLYAASDLYHQNPSGMAETGYVESRDQAQMWQEAKQAAQAVMDLGIYDLYKANPAPDDSVARNYYELFITYGTEEAILERYYPEGEGSEFLESNEPHGPDQYHGPNGYHQWGGNTPTQQLVDSYRMKDGSKFQWDNPIHASAPYKNRDPRFYASILYDGASWYDRTSDVAQFDEDNVVQTFRSLTLPNGSDVGGVDSRESPVESWNATYSGYYMRKFIDEEHPPPLAQSSVWMYFRYAEILLNYAEASIELNEFGDARDAINRIRERVNMPEIPSTVSGEDLENIYRNERRIELVFEEQRYFDIRRWMTAPELMNQDARGINIEAEATSRADRDSYSNYEYEVTTYQERRWEDKMYFKPIREDEMNRNDQLVQNPGY